MQFIRYESFRQYLRLYPVTSAIMAANLVLFVLMTVYGGSTSSGTLYRFGAMYKFDADTAAQLGIPAAAEWWRYFSAIFLHIGVQHLLFNTFSLLVFAPPLERTLGHLRYLFFYLVSGTAGNIASRLFQDEYIGAGASGAIYGIFAAYLYMGWFVRNRMDPASRKTVNMVLLMGLVYSIVVPHVDLYAHAGGFVGGFLLMALLARRVNAEGGNVISSKRPVIAGIYAHPDDEAFSAAAAFHEAARRGCRVVGFCATAGEAGSVGPRLGLTPEQLAGHRRQELRQAASIIGYEEIAMLDFPDGGLSRNPEALLAEVTAFLQRHRPDVVVTFPEDGLNGHPDHIAISRAAREAVTGGSCPFVRKLYYIELPESAAGRPQPSVVVDIAPHAAVKRAALLAHATQVPSVERVFGDLRPEGAVIAGGMRFERFVLAWEAGVWFPSKKESFLTDGLEA